MLCTLRTNGDTDAPLSGWVDVGFHNRYAIANPAYGWSEVVKLAFALFTYFPYGGLTRDLIAIARACQQRGHQVRVYAGGVRGDADEVADSVANAELDLRVLSIKSRSGYTKDRRFAEQLPRAIAEFSPDLIVGFNKMPGLDVYYAADGCFAQKSRQRGWWYRMTPRCRHHLAFEKAVFSCEPSCASSRLASTKILMIAHNQIGIYQNCYDTPKARMVMLPPGILRDRIAGDDAQARRDRFRTHWRLDDDHKLLLAVGSGFRTKGLDRTLTALASLPPGVLDKTRLFIVGSDKASPFERMARRLGVHSKVWFFQGRDDVPEFLLGADMLMHPAYRENTGTVLLEAMVAGLPVITTDVCGYAHYVHDEKLGEVLASPFDQAALNQALRRLIKVERNTWRTRAHDFAQDADIYDMPLHACQRIEEIFERNADKQIA